MSQPIDPNDLIVCSICAAVVHAPSYEGHEQWHQHLIDQITTGSPVEPTRLPPSAEG